jgi:dihydropteroate synthase
MRASVAVAALAAGAVLVNDVSGGLADPDMLGAVAAARSPYVVMHWRGHSADMQTRAVYGDVVAEVCDELAQRLEACAAAGIAEVVVDPGIGFAKTAEHNWALLRALPRLQALGPLLLGSSRKAFLGALLDGRPPKGRDAATTALTALAAAAGAWGVRVHDVAGSADAVRVVQRLRDA